MVAELARPVKHLSEYDEYSKEMNGWLLPDGRIYYNRFEEHYITEDKLRAGGHTLEAMGAVKLQVGEFYTRHQNNRVTQAQLNAIYRFYEKKGLTVEEIADKLGEIEVHE